jgi:FtsP/CotA-like multicopper oxidase with cupredoxin domain
MIPSTCASRRYFLQSVGALGLAAIVRPTQSDSAATADFCAAGDGKATPLFVPRDSGYLGRLALRGKPLTLVASAAGTLPPRVVHGPIAYRAQHEGRDYINPTLVVRRGERVQVELVNRLDAPTIAHWHGLAVDARNDGAGMNLIVPGERFAYDFEARDRGALYWYHPHPHGETARQTYTGLYGAIQLEDDDEDSLRNALDLVPGRTEIALVMQDRRADSSYSPSTVDLMHGVFGDELYVNGTRCPYLDVGSRVYRLRILNACNARTLRLALRGSASAQISFIVIGNDGGLFPASQRAEQVFLAAAERLDILVDLRDAPVGETLALESLAFDPMHIEMAGTTATDHAGHDHGSAWPEGAARALLQLRVRERVVYNRPIPAKLSSVAPIDTSTARERPFRLGFNKGRWRINDRVFVMGETPIEVARDSTEIWLVRNYHTSMPHAMHLHGFHFEILERETSPDFIHALAIDEHGRLAADLGRKDTVLVWPGESVRVAIRFAMPFPGPQTYVFHCHNLEHEDGGMMLGVKVV